MSVDPEQLEELESIEQRYCVSIYMPTHRSSDGMEEDRIRLKNLISAAEGKLEALGVKPREVREQLQPAWDLLRDSGLWRNAADALALFLTHEQHRVFRVSRSLEEHLAVGPRFDLAPLRPVASDRRKVYILPLSKGSVRLYEATPEKIRPVPLPEAPSSFEEMMRFVETEKQSQWHTGTEAHQPGGDRPAVFHGQGAAGDDRTRNMRLEEYVKQVAHGVDKALNNQKAPLLIAAAEPIASVYRQVNTYPHLMDQQIQGNADRATAKDLHDQAARIAFEQGA
jgi:hypothetical protein